MPGLTDDDVARELALVDARDSFATVDELVGAARELAATRPDVASIDVIGASADGEPIECLVIAGGSRSAVVVGFPHPNEPVGGLAAVHLARRLVADDDLRRRLDLSWFVVPCIDPDGARLNETWFARPWDRAAYLRGFYRPPGDRQVEWTFPFRHRHAGSDIVIDAPIPETRAFMHLIDRARPVLLASLHNSESGGAYFYLSRAVPDLHAPLARIAELVGLPLDAGEPEAPGIPVLAPGVFQIVPIADIYDDVAAAGGRVDLIAGASSADYAAPHGTLSLVCEVPQWLDEQSADDRPTTDVYADVVAAQGDAFARAAGELQHIVDIAGDDLVESPFRHAVSMFLADMVDVAATTTRRAAETASLRPATVAERWSCTEAVFASRGRVAAMLVRAIETAIAAGATTPDLLAADRRARALLDGWLAETTTGSSERPAPIAALVAAQHLSILETALRLDRPPTRSVT